MPSFIAVQDDTAVGALGAVPAEVAEVVAVLAHPDGRAQVILARAALEALGQVLEELLSGLLCVFRHFNANLQTELNGQITLSSDMS